jgi:TRAP-type C4-dicarboxylate transport system permease small subunit
MKKINNCLNSIFHGTIIIMMIVMVLIVFVQVVMRYIFNNAFNWADEAARYLLVWITCLGAACAVREGLHISVVYIKERLSDNLQRYLILITGAIIIAFSIVCLIEGLKLSISEWNQNTTGLQIRITWVFLAIPVGFFVIITNSFELLFENIKKIKLQKPRQKNKL